MDMWMIKGAGSVLVCLSCALAGRYMGQRGSRRLAELLELRRALNILGSEIEFAMNPLPRALRNIADKTSGAVSGLFLGASEGMGQKSGADFNTIWRGCLEEAWPQSCLEREDIDAAAALGATLGYLDRSLQLAAIAQCVMYIDGRTAELATENARKKRLYYGLGAACGVLVAVIML